MGRTANSYRRSAPRFKPQPTVLIICEDSKSGKRYLEDAAQYFRAGVKVEVTHCGKTDPLNIVEEALRRQGKFDRVYCAIDRDRHETFSQAVNRVASSEKIDLIVSYPCFEFWLLLHFGFNNKPYVAEGKHSPGDCVIKDLRTYAGMENYEKGAPMSIFGLMGAERLKVAREQSPRVLATAIKAGDLNPSTRMHVLINELEVLGEPIPV